MLADNVMGLYYDFASQPVGDLEIGKPPLHPHIAFGGETATSNNKSAALFLCNTPGTVAAGGDDWSKCPPSSATQSSCSTAPTTYSDIVLAGTGPGTVSVTDCTVGP